MENKISIRCVHLKILQLTCTNKQIDKQTNRELHAHITFSYRNDGRRVLQINIQMEIYLLLNDIGELSSYSNIVLSSTSIIVCIPLAAP